MYVDIFLCFANIELFLVYTVFDNFFIPFFSCPSWPFYPVCSVYKFQSSLVLLVDHLLLLIWSFLSYFSFLTVIARLFSPIYRLLSAILSILILSSLIYSLLLISCSLHHRVHFIKTYAESIAQSTFNSSSLSNVHIIFSPYFIHSCPSFLINLLWFSLSAYMLSQFTLFIYIYRVYHI
jgi:hypothetical protein